MTLSCPSAFAALTKALMPPLDAADVAVDHEGSLDAPHAATVATTVNARPRRVALAAFFLITCFPFRLTLTLRSRSCREPFLVRNRTKAPREWGASTSSPGVSELIIALSRIDNLGMVAARRLRGRRATDPCRRPRAQTVLRTLSRSAVAEDDGWGGSDDDNTRCLCQPVRCLAGDRRAHRRPVDRCRSAGRGAVREGRRRPGRL